VSGWHNSPDEEYSMASQAIINLSQVLDLAGKLDDSEGENTPRERFRQFLKKNVLEVGQVRDYVEECLRNSGDQYSRALQDLVNYIGHFLGFAVEYGRYQGVQGQIGYDGHWTSPTGFHLVIEVKTTNVYAIKIDTLVGYIDKLISSEKKIANWDVALGLYVVGKPEEGIKQLDNAIIAEKRTHQLRVISVDALLSLAEMSKLYGLTHKDALAVIRPSAPTVDWVVNLMTTLVSQPAADILPPVAEPSDTPKPAATPVKVKPKKRKPIPTAASEVVYWLTPVKGDEDATAEAIVQRLVGQEGIYAFGDNTPGRKSLKPGDWICFYASGKGIVGQARVASAPQKKGHPKVHHPEKYRWVFKLSNVGLYLDKPIVIDAALRSQLDAFQGKDVNGPWAWFVQATHKLSQHDFEFLTKTTKLDAP
jgi:hypothetical protein